MPEYEARFMELLRYAPHLNTEKLKVNRFVFGLKQQPVRKGKDSDASKLARCCPKIPHSRGGAYQWGSDPDPSETCRTGFIWYAAAADVSETYDRISWFPEGIHFCCTLTVVASTADTLSRTTTAVAASLAAAAV